MRSNNLKKWFGVSIVTLLVVFIVSTTLSEFSCSKKEEVIKIGAILPLTGNAAVVGGWYQNGIEIAVDEINETGGINDKKVKIVYGDSKNDPKEGVAITQRLINVDKLPVIVSAMSSVTMAIIPIIDEAKTVLVCGLTRPGITDLSPYLFRYFLRMDLEGERMANFAYTDLRIRKVVTFYVNDEAGLRGQEAFQKIFKDLGGQILAAESFDIGNTDLRSVLIKLKSLNPDAFYFVGYEKTMGIAIKQLHEIGASKTILANAGLAIGSVRGIAGEAAEGAYFTTAYFFPESEKPIVRDFANTYRNKFKSEPVAEAGYYYGIIRMVSKAIENQGYNTESIRKGLLEIKNMPGVCGDITVLPNGDVDVPIAIAIFKEGKELIIE